MAKPFKGVTNIDIRNSTPDWAPYEQPEAPDGAPNVLVMVWDNIRAQPLGLPVGNTPGSTGRG
jgi:hypothetical protein